MVGVCHACRKRVPTAYQLRHERMWVRGTLGAVYELSESQTVELDRLWAELGSAYPLTSPPQTDAEMLADDLDSWIAGVMSSRGQFTRESFDYLVTLVDEVGAAEGARSIADAVLMLIRSAVEATQ